jgi:hypothetical protein
VISSN